MRNSDHSNADKHYPPTHEFIDPLRKLLAMWEHRLHPSSAASTTRNTVGRI
jgi:hypothetical protein